MKYKIKFKINTTILNLGQDISYEVGCSGIYERAMPFIDKKSRLSKIIKSDMPNVDFIDKKDSKSLKLKEVNVLKLYENIRDLDPGELVDFIRTYFSLIDESRYSFRSLDLSKEFGIYKNHKNVSKLIQALFEFMRSRPVSYGFITAAIFRYELENIQPFSTFNSEIGKFWQRLILSKCFRIFEFVPLPEDYEEYCLAVKKSREKKDLSIFIEYYLKNLLKCIKAYSKSLKRRRRKIELDIRNKGVLNTKNSLKIDLNI